MAEKLATIEIDIFRSDAEFKKGEAPDVNAVARSFAHNVRADVLRLVKLRLRKYRMTPQQFISLTVR